MVSLLVTLRKQRGLAPRPVSAVSQEPNGKIAPSCCSCKVLEFADDLQISFLSLEAKLCVKRASKNFPCSLSRATPFHCVLDSVLQSSPRLPPPKQTDYGATPEPFARFESRQHSPKRGEHRASRSFASGQFLASDRCDVALSNCPFDWPRS